MHGKQKSHNSFIPHYKVEPRGLFTSFENKFIDTTFNQTVTNGGTVGYINMPPQGNSSSSRVADRCRLLSLDLRSFITLSTSATEDNFRFVIFQSVGLLPISTPPALTDVLEYTLPNSPIKYNATKLFHILYDSQHSLSIQGDSAAIVLHKEVNLSIKAINFVAGSIVAYSGQLYYLMIGTQATNFTTTSSTARLWFADTD